MRLEILSHPHELQQPTLRRGATLGRSPHVFELSLQSVVNGQARGRTAAIQVIGARVAGMSDEPRSRGPRCRHHRGPALAAQRPKDLLVREAESVL